MVGVRVQLGIQRLQGLRTAHAEHKNSEDDEHKLSEEDEKKYIVPVIVGHKNDEDENKQSEE